MHNKNDVRPLNHWVKIKETRFFQSTGNLKKPPQLHLLRLNNILPNQGLRIAGKSHQLLGHQTIEEYEFGPGLHEIDIFSSEVPIAVKVTSELPRIPLAVLPPLNKDTLTVGLMLQDDFTDNPACQFVSSSYPNRGERATGSVEPLLDTNLINSSSNGCYRAVSLPECQCDNCVLLIPACMGFTSYNQYIRREATFIKAHLRQWQAMGETPHTRIYREAQMAKHKATKNFPAILKLIENSDEALEEGEIFKQMTSLLWIAEQSPALAQQAVVAGAALFHRHSTVAKLRSLWAALRTHHHWQKVQSLESAGVHLIKIRGWQPESPNQRIRKTLLKPIEENEQVISGYRQMGLSLLNLADTSIEVALQMDDISSSMPVPMNVRYWLDKQPPRRLRLTNKKPNKIIRLKVPKGEHVFYVAIDKPIVNQFLRLRIKETGRNETQLFWEYERTYHIATPEEPVVVNVKGPNWLRIDEWQSNEIHSRFQKVEKGLHKLTFTPPPGQESAFLRIHELTEKTEKPPAVQFRYTTRASRTMPAPIVQIHKLPPVKQLEVKDAFPLARRGTWSLTSLLQRRKNFEEDETGFQDFLELRATHRYFDEMKNRHYKTDGLLRSNDQLDITLGAKQQIRYRPEGYDFTAQLSGAAYMQQLWNNGIEWHGFLKGSLFQYRKLSDKTYHVPSFSAYGRLLSLNKAHREYATRLDNDVYSNYKADHRFGIRIAEKISHRPWLDTLWTGRLSLTSNENFLKPDYLSFKPVWKQMLGDGQLDIGYRFLHYWTDDDRKSPYNRHFLSLDASWNLWQSNQTRWEWGLKLRQNFNDNDLLGMFYITWHDSKGRAYRDFMSNEIDFLDLRKRQLPELENNEIIRLH